MLLSQHAGNEPEAPQVGTLVQDVDQKPGPETAKVHFSLVRTFPANPGHELRSPHIDPSVSEPSLLHPRSHEVDHEMKDKHHDRPMKPGKATDTQQHSRKRRMNETMATDAEHLAKHCGASLEHSQSVRGKKNVPQNVRQHKKEEHAHKAATGFLKLQGIIAAHLPQTCVVSGKSEK